MAVCSKHIPEHVKVLLNSDLSTMQKGMAILRFVSGVYCCWLLHCEFLVLECELGQEQCPLRLVCLKDRFPVAVKG